MKKNLMEVKKMMIKKLIDFFNVYDEDNIFHNGFLQSIDLSAYTDITFLNELTLNIIDGFLHNEIGNMLTSARWSKFLEWDKETKTYKVKSEFYTQATTALYTYLLRGEKLYTLTQMDFRSLSASETESIVYGQKEEVKEYDKVVVSVERGNDTTQYGAQQRSLSYGLHETDTDYGQNARTLVYGQMEKTNVNGARSETNTIGTQTNTSTNINQTHPYDMQTFLDNTKDERTDMNGSRSDGHIANSYTDTETNLSHTDTDTFAGRKDTVTDKAHIDTDNTNAYIDTNTYGDVTNTTDARQDNNTIKTHTDTKTRTKIILLSPDKYFEIQKELLQHNIYDIMKDCVKDCFTIHTFYRGCSL